MNLYTYLVSEDCLLKIFLGMFVEIVVSVHADYHGLVQSRDAWVRNAYVGSMDERYSLCSFFAHLMMYSTTNSSMVTKLPDPGEPLGPRYMKKLGMFGTATAMYASGLGSHILERVIPFRPVMGVSSVLHELPMLNNFTTQR